MIYLIGGAPRTGKSILCRQISSKLNTGWISTDLVMELLRVKNIEGMKAEWNATPEAITANAEWFSPYLKRLVWWASHLPEGYVIEGVEILPAQVAELLSHFPIRAVFLGCSQMTLERFDRFPGYSPGYAFLPEETRLQFAQDILRWSEYVRQQAEAYGYPYVDMIDGFHSRLSEASDVLTAGLFSEDFYSEV